MTGPSDSLTANRKEEERENDKGFYWFKGSEHVRPITEVGNREEHSF